MDKKNTPEPLTDAQILAYKSSMKKLAEQGCQLTEKQVEWNRQILFLVVTLFGILTSLHTKTISVHPSRWLYAGAVAFFALGILTGSIAVYAEIHYRKQARKIYLANAQRAVRADGKIEPVIVSPNKLIERSEIIFYISSLIGLILIATYAIIVTFI
jgi:hypothetical protein